MEFRIEKREAIRVLGISTPLSSDVEKAYEEAEALWVEILTDGAPKDADGNFLEVGGIGTKFAELNAAVNAKYSDGSLPKHNGFFCIETEHDSDGEYIIAVESPQPASGNLKEYIIPAHTWAVFPGKNFFANEYHDADSAVKHEERLYSEWLPTSGYEIADTLNVHFVPATTDLKNAPFETWLPVKR